MNIKDWQLTHWGWDNPWTDRKIFQVMLNQCTQHDWCWMSETPNHSAVLLVNHQWIPRRFVRVKCLFTVVKTIWYSFVEPGLGDTAGDAGICFLPSLASPSLASSRVTDSSSPSGSWEVSFVPVSVALLKPLVSCSTVWEKVVRFKTVPYLLIHRWA